MIDWPASIYELYQQQQRLTDYPVSREPGAAASEDAIAAAQKRLGVVFDDSYLRVIRAVNCRQNVNTDPRVASEN